ncbi:hypothetical protein [Nonomuraea turcica]|uniref:hypothetical protein n=1 Tax=Nonomuraea sp. G32 TaxID=3067274 RepID=UPI00273C85B7|nr:hypothetical protein [Nonomuraea sp. G32]MDP4510309.1 hypothetical protein [Nonomuraea sp. G32]
MTTTAATATIATLSDILKVTTSELDSALQQMGWAEEEIAAAAERHPAAADTLFHSWPLLKPTRVLISTEFVYRAHCRELLDRVTAGQDTRPGTAAEACCACCHASLIAPLTSYAAGLYLRTWAKAFPDQVMFADMHKHHEELEGRSIDDLATGLRRKLTIEDRKLGTIECSGRHHGEPVQCRYAGLGLSGLPGDAGRRRSMTARPTTPAAARPSTTKQRPPLPDPLF